MFHAAICLLALTRAPPAPAAVWLSGLHIPESYLSALVQTTCRRKNWPLDKSTLYTQVRWLRGPVLWGSLHPSHAPPPRRAGHTLHVR